MINCTLLRLRSEILTQRQRTMAERVSFDELYRRSTQYRVWSFTRQGLAIQRQAVNEKGQRKVDERLASMPEVDATMVEKVTVREELQLISFHARSIGKLANFFNMPSQVRATAISFFRKFYLVNSVMEYHPKLILLTCLFLAAKSENFFISINSFCKRIPKTTPESILGLEFEILQSLKFTLMAHHPFRPLYGFFFDIQDTLGTDVTSKDLGKVYDSARSMINDALISDAVFHFTPPQIALACFKSTDEVLTMKYLNKKFNRGDKQEVDEESLKDQPVTDYETLLQLIDECQEFIRTSPNPTKEEAILVDKKVQFCVNPTLVLKRKRGETAGTEGDQNKRQRTESMEPSLSAQ